LNGGADQDALLGGVGNDILNGGPGNDLMFGEAGDDIYAVDSGGDVVNEIGGSGIDTVHSSISFDLANTAKAKGDVEKLSLSGTLAINGTGNALNNVMAGNEGANIMDGRQGTDVIRGKGGADALIGGAGIDTLTGDAGNDFFIFNAPLSAANRDVITDFSNVAGNNDTFRLENSVMPALGGPGPLSAQAFFAGAAAHDADDRIIYNKATGALFYDANGIASGGVTHLGTLTTKPTLTASDFSVI
jgi:Ca2+-binding RTX toxin-like protein